MAGECRRGRADAQVSTRYCHLEVVVQICTATQEVNEQPLPVENKVIDTRSAVALRCLTHGPLGGSWPLLVFSCPVATCKCKQTSCKSFVGKPRPQCLEQLSMLGVTTTHAQRRCKHQCQASTRIRSLDHELPVQAAPWKPGCDRCGASSGHSRSSGGRPARPSSSPIG